MITVTVNPTEDCLFSVSKFFDYEYEPEWFDDPIVKQMVMDTDKIEVVNANTFMSPIFGTIS